MNLLAVFSFCEKDLFLAEALADHIAELGNVSDFDALIVTTEETPFAKVQRALSGAFRKVDVLELHDLEAGIPKDRLWPIACNRQFSQTAQHCSRLGVPFIFLEADVVPTRATWLKELNAGYIACARPFMGAVRPSMIRQGGTLAQDGEHMVGMGVYPFDLCDYSDLITYITTANMPFDYALQGEVVYGAGAAAQRPWGSGCYNTPLISHHWSTRNWRCEDGVLKCDQDKPEAICDTPDIRIPALAHGCKDLSLLNLVREQFNDVMRTHLPGSAWQSTSTSGDGSISLDVLRDLNARREATPLPKDGLLRVASPHVDELARIIKETDAEFERGEALDSLNQRRKLSDSDIDDALNLLKSIQVLDENMQPVASFGDAPEVPPPDYPSVTEGSVIARATRESANGMTAEQRAEMQEQGMAIVNANRQEMMAWQNPSLTPNAATEYVERTPERVELHGEDVLNVLSPEVRDRVTGTAPEDQAEAPIFDEESIHAAIREDSKKNGLTWKQLLAKYKYSPKKLKQILNQTA